MRRNVKTEHFILSSHCLSLGISFPHLSYGLEPALMFNQPRYSNGLCFYPLLLLAMNSTAAIATTMIAGDCDYRNILKRE
jgi:hypothetical protein